MSSALALAAATLRRVARDRTFVFFLVLVPVLIILVIGVSAGGFDRFRIGVVDPGEGRLGAAVADALAEQADVAHYDDIDAARTAVRRGEVDTAVVLPDDLDATVEAGDQASLAVLADDVNATQQAALSTVRGVVARQAAAAEAAHFASERTGVGFDEALAEVRDLQASDQTIGVRTTVVDAESAFLPSGISYSAPTTLVLFVFINSLVAGAALIENRQLGIHDRVLAAPVPPRNLLAGETLAFLGIALAQSLIIVGLGAVLFGVDWGNPLAAAALVLTWALVGTGAGMLAGSLFRTSEQASSIGPAVGVALGMLGGTMWPLELVPDVLANIGRLTPHAWAVDAWVELMSRGGGLVEIALPLTVLLAFAAAFLGLATLRLRRTLLAT